MFRRQPKTATAWVARLNAGPLSPGEERALARWISSNPNHSSELKSAQAADRLARELKNSQVARNRLAADLLAHDEAQSRKPTPLRRFAFPSFSAAVAAGIALFVVIQQDSSAPARLGNNVSTSTAIGEISTFVLPDLTQITVAADTSVSVDFVDDRRGMSLERGEAFFDVAPDATRPFVIKVGERTVTVTGTKFNVNYYAAQNDMEVAVLEGHINVAFRTPQADTNEEKRVEAGQVILFPAAGPIVHRNLTPEQAAAWRTRNLYFDSANLSQVLTVVNRYVAKPLVMEKDDAEHLFLTGQFPAGDVDSVLVALRQLYGIEAREAGRQWLLIQKPNMRRTN